MQIKIKNVDFLVIKIDAKLTPYDFDWLHKLKYKLST